MFSKRSTSYVTDGKHTVHYEDAFRYYDALERYFAGRHISSEDRVAVHCKNDVPSAIVLIWMLKRKQNFFISTEPGRSHADESHGYNGPECCRYGARVLSDDGDFTPDRVAAFVTVDVNRSWTGDPKAGSARGLFLSTSGSELEPKVVCHCAGNLANNAYNCVTRYQLRSSDRVIIPVPINHLYGFGAALLAGVLAGASLGLVEQANVIRYVDLERRFEPNVAFLTPGLCDMLLNTVKKKRNYRLAISSGDKTNENTITKFEAMFGPLLSQYGSTELGAVASAVLEDPLETRARGFHKCFENVTITQERGESTEDGMSELLCRHRYGFLGYVDKTGCLLEPDEAGSAWFHTKDVGRVFEDGRFQVCGRLDDCINRSGMLVPLNNVDSLINRSVTDLEATFVTAVDLDTRRGKKIVAFCVPKSGKSMSGREVRSACYRLMPKHMVPDEVRIIESLPRLASGKIDRRKLRQMASGMR